MMFYSVAQSIENQINLDYVKHEPELKIDDKNLKVAYVEHESKTVENNSFSLFKNKEEVEDQEYLDCEQYSTEVIQFSGMKNLSAQEIENEIDEIKKELPLKSRSQENIWEDPYDLFLFSQLINLENSQNLDVRFEKKPIMHFSIIMATSLTCPPCLISKNALKSGDPQNWQASFKIFKEQVANELQNIVDCIFDSTKEFNYKSFPQEIKKYDIPDEMKAKFIKIHSDVQDAKQDILKTFNECFYSNLVFITFQNLKNTQTSRKYFEEYSSNFFSKIQLLKFEYFPAFFKLLFDSQLIDENSQITNPIGNCISLEAYFNATDACPPKFVQNAFKDKIQGQRLTNLAHWIVEKPYYSMIYDQISVEEEAKQRELAKRENKVKENFIKNMAEYFFKRFVQEIRIRED